MSTDPHRVTASATLSVEVKCESCHSIYEYDHSISLSSEDQNEYLKTRRGTTTECEKALEYILNACLKRESVSDLGYKACKQCSHMQSWMQQSAGKEKANFLSVCLSFFLTKGTLAIINKFDLISLNMLDWVSTPIFIFCGIFYFVLGRRIFLTAMLSPYEIRTQNPPDTGYWLSLFIIILCSIFFPLLGLIIFFTARKELMISKSGHPPPPSSSGPMEIRIKKPPQLKVEKIVDHSTGHS